MPHVVFSVLSSVRSFLTIRVSETQGDNAGEALDGAAGGPLHLRLVLETSVSFGMHSAH